MAVTDQGVIWAEASSPPIAGLVRRYVDDWDARRAGPPDPRAYLPDDPARRDPALLALLRADLALRRRSGEPAQVERYLRGFPDLGDEVLVALLYEEFCLREEAGENPDASEYRERFPAVAGQLEELLAIHEFVGAAGDRLSWPGPSATASPFPAVGETIGGFRLVVELGRGAIARAYLAEERHLGDRRVALKVSRAGSREPQTLALLQHTHIVPLHSYRVDDATGLHLLCMPYLGRVTLAGVLSDPRARSARTGGDLLAILDDLCWRGDVGTPLAARSEAREALRGRTAARAVAWWGARLAEGLHHAHNRGVLHRDIKPSNVLITADATPMLLDFNLARPSEVDDAGTADVGGTPAYMAPEHIAAAAGDEDGPPVDGRADIYSLGVVLHEALASRRFAPHPVGRGEVEGLHRLIEARKTPAPRLRTGAGGRKVPPALAAVVRRCLEPDPGDRYASASDLAADLQAVADDGPLRFCREPQPGRALRWASRNRRTLAVAVGLLALVAVAFAAQSARFRREAMARGAFEAVQQSAARGEFEAAAAHFALAADRTGRSWSASLRSLAAEANRRKQDALDAARIRDRADAFLDRAESLRYRLITRHGLDSASRELPDAFAEFGILGPAPWTRSPELDRLDPDRRERLIEEANELLFLWVVAADRPADPRAARRAAAICGRALSFAEPRAPWLALKARYDEPGRPSIGSTPAPSAEDSARACFEWGLLRVRAGRADQALAWFERAVELRPDRFWYQFALACHHAEYGDSSKAMGHYTAALALRPRSSWALLNRAQVAWSRLGAWESAMSDLGRASARPDDLDPRLLRLELGRVAHRLGDFPRALAHLEAVATSDPGGDLGRRARSSRARVEAELGPAGRRAAWAEYAALLADDPDDAGVRFSRAVLALRNGRPAVAEDDLTRLLRGEGAEAGGAVRRAGWLATRAVSRLALRRPDDAVHDAEEAVRLAPSPGRLRVFARAAIAAGREAELAVPDPDDLARLPASGPALVADLRAAASRLRVGNGLAGPSPRLARAAMLGALGDHAEAVREADRAIALAPTLPEAWLLRARVRRRAGDRGGAAADVTQGLALAPGDARLRTLRGILLVDRGDALAGREALDLALATGGGGPAHAARARALRELGRVDLAIGEWTLALRDDPEDADAFLGRARCFIQLGRWEAALADLESAVDWSGGRPAVLGPTTLSYAACLPRRPGHLSRVLGLACRIALARLR